VGCEFKSHPWQFFNFILRDQFIINIVNINIALGVGNAISVIQADGVTLEGVTPIRQAAYSHFTSHFKALNMERPGADNLHFKQLSQIESGNLIKPFSEAEVKATRVGLRQLQKPRSGRDKFWVL
jgi:hypothetical protein